MKFINFEGKYKIYELTTGNYIVKDQNGKTVYVTRSEASAKDWCKRH